MKEIYHLSWMADTDAISIDRILNEGIKSRSQLTKEGIWKAIPPVNDFEKWRFGCVYFGLRFPPESVNWFSLLVDPNETLIGNQSLEYSYGAYRESVITLADYLGKQSQGKGEYRHPLTAERLEKSVKIVVPDSFSLAHCGFMGTRQVEDYFPEVFIEADAIPTDRIHRYNIVRR